MIATRRMSRLRRQNGRLRRSCRSAIARGRAVESINFHSGAGSVVRGGPAAAGPFRRASSARFIEANGAYQAAHEQTD